MSVNNPIVVPLEVNVSEPASYSALVNKPKINNIELSGNKTAAELGLASSADMGNKNGLNTATKTSLVAAINEVNNATEKTYIITYGDENVTLQDIHNAIQPQNPLNLRNVYCRYPLNYGGPTTWVLAPLYYLDEYVGAIFATMYFEPDLNNPPTSGYWIKAVYAFSPLTGGWTHSESDL